MMVYSLAAKKTCPIDLVRVAQESVEPLVHAVEKSNRCFPSQNPSELLAMSFLPNGLLVCFCKNLTKTRDENS